MIIVVKRIVALLIATTVLTLIGMGCSSDNFTKAIMKNTVPNLKPAVRATPTKKSKEI